MSTKRLLAIGVVFVCTAVAWAVLGSSVVVRTGQLDERLAVEVARLWGGQHAQVAPAASVERPRESTETVEEKDAQGRTISREVKKMVTEWHSLPLGSSRVTVGLDLDARRKGLLWFDTYAVEFEGRYWVMNPDEVARTVKVVFDFPSKEAIYDGFVFRLDGRDVPFTGDMSQGLSGTVLLAPGARATIEVSYRSRGLQDWSYAFAPSGIAQVQDFLLEMTTDFEKIDFPPGTVSPTSKDRQGDGWRLAWEFSSLVTGSRIGMDPPHPINPGPLVARITYFAPVSLLFFLTVMVILGILGNQNLHPMNYFFLSAAFFSFHLMLAYLADHLDIHLSFVIAAAISVTLVVTYLRLVGGMRLAFRQAGLAQIVYLVMFSYAFFFEGYTGLTITTGAVLTLFVLMQLTAKVDWVKVFGVNRVEGSTGRP
ncbi:MAG TPA: inner membrane CreD family protein [Candidatus Polarisedimenticolia bacterium]|nr:inner membrane CreD family protein [Candidatus Polarisedimenticolia bacterium]